MKSKKDSMKVVKINKTVRGGIITHHLIFLEDRSNEGINYEVEEWAFNEPSGSNYGYSIKWELVEDESEIQKVLVEKIKNIDTKINRFNEEKVKMQSHLKFI